MAESSWHFAELIMVLFGMQTTILLAVLGGMWASILSTKKDLHSLSERVAKIEGALSAKDCCMLKDDRLKQRAE